MLYHLVYAIDARYAQHVCVSLQSLLQHNPDLSFRVHVIHQGLAPLHLHRFAQIAQPYACQILARKAPEGILDRLRVNHHFSTANYLRLLIPELVNAERALYLDADVIVNGPIAGVYHTDLADTYLAAVPDYLIETMEPTYRQRLGMDESARYFNSGVMLLNLAKWKTEELGQQAIEYTRTHPERILYVDQCSLNAVVNGNWQPMHPAYNLQTCCFDKRLSLYDLPEVAAARKQPVLIQFSGSSKPWHIRCSHPYKFLYWKHLFATPYRFYRPEDLSFFNVLRSLTPGAVREYGYRLRKSLSFKNQFDKPVRELSGR